MRRRDFRKIQSLGDLALFLEERIESNGCRVIVVRPIAGRVYWVFAGLHKLQLVIDENNKSRFTFLFRVDRDQRIVTKWRCGHRLNSEGRERLLEVLDRRRLSTE